MRPLAWIAISFWNSGFAAMLREGAEAAAPARRIGSPAGILAVGLGIAAPRSPPAPRRPRIAASRSSSRLIVLRAVPSCFFSAAVSSPQRLAHEGRSARGTGARQRAASPTTARARTATRRYVGPDFMGVAKKRRRAAGKCFPTRGIPACFLVAGGVRPAFFLPLRPRAGAFGSFGRAGHELEAGGAVLLQGEEGAERAARALAPELLQEVGLAGLQHLHELLERDVAGEDAPRAARRGSCPRRPRSGARRSSAGSRRPASPRANLGGGASATGCRPVKSILMAPVASRWPSKTNSAFFSSLLYLRTALKGLPALERKPSRGPIWPLREEVLHLGLRHLPVADDLVDHELAVLRLVAAQRLDAAACRRSGETMSVTRAAESSSSKLFTRSTMPLVCLDHLGHELRRAGTCRAPSGAA